MKEKANGRGKGCLFHIRSPINPVSYMLDTPHWAQTQFKVYSTLVKLNFIEMMWKQLSFNQCVQGGSNLNPNHFLSGGPYTIGVHAVHPSSGTRTPRGTWPIYKGFLRRLMRP